MYEKSVKDSKLIGFLKSQLITLKAKVAFFATRLPPRTSLARHEADCLSLLDGSLRLPTSSMAVTVVRHLSLKLFRRTA